VEALLDDALDPGQGFVGDQVVVVVEERLFEI
jgi:hypothetical protein